MTSSTQHNLKIPDPEEAWANEYKKQGIPSSPFQIDGAGFAKFPNFEFT